MRILIVHNTLNDSRSMSGVLRHYLWMANAWTEAGHPTDFVVARAGWPQVQELAPRSRLISSDNIFDATRYLDQTWRYFPAYAWRLASAHWLTLPDHYDLIYASSQLIFEVYPSMVLARRQQAKLAVKIHHVVVAQPGRVGWFDRLFGWTERRSVRWMNRRSDAIICSTPVVAEDYRRLEEHCGLCPRATHTIGYGIDLSAKPFDPDAPKRFDVVFLGRLHEHKGVFELPSLWKLVRAQEPQARLLVIGEGPHRRRTEQLFRELGLDASATFTGGISEFEKNKLLAECRIGVSLSHEEGWGLSITEMMAAGLPVAAYELPVFVQAFPHQLDLVKLGDGPALAQKVLALMRDESRRRRRGLESRQFIERYDYRHVAQEELRALSGSAPAGAARPGHKAHKSTAPNPLARPDATG